MKKKVLLMLMYISLNVFSFEYTGNWKKAAYTTRGSWSIVSRDDGIYVILDDEFKTKKGPDLFILLSPKSYDEVTDENADVDAYKVAQLESFKGGAEYRIADDEFDIERYESILIHCVEYSHLWAGSDIDKD